MSVFLLTKIGTGMKTAQDKMRGTISEVAFNQKYAKIYTGIRVYALYNEKEMASHRNKGFL